VAENDTQKAALDKLIQYYKTGQPYFQEIGGTRTLRREEEVILAKKTFVIEENQETHDEVLLFQQENLLAQTKKRSLTNF